MKWWVNLLLLIFLFIKLKEDSMMISSLVETLGCGKSPISICFPSWEFEVETGSYVQLRLISPCRYMKVERTCTETCAEILKTNQQSSSTSWLEPRQWVATWSDAGHLTDWATEAPWSTIRLSRSIPSNMHSYLYLIIFSPFLLQNMDLA